MKILLPAAVGCALVTPTVAAPLPFFTFHGPFGNVTLQGQPGQPAPFFGFSVKPVQPPPPVVIAPVPPRPMPPIVAPATPPVATPPVVASPTITPVVPPVVVLPVAPPPSKPTKMREHDHDRDHADDVKRGEHGGKDDDYGFAKEHFWGYRK